MRALRRVGLADTGFAVFRLREYRLFWIAAAFSNVGMWTLIYGRLWLMRSLTDSEVLLGLVTAATQVPILLLTMFGGVLADRINRLRVLQLTRLLFAAAGFLTAFLIVVDAMNEWILIGIASATGVMLAFDIPARSAMVASLVDKRQLPSAISLYSIVFGGAAIVGPTLFHPLVSIAGLEGVFAIVAASYLLTVITLLRMDPGLHERAGRDVEMERTAASETAVDQELAYASASATAGEPEPARVVGATAAVGGATAATAASEASAPRGGGSGVGADASADASPVRASATSRHAMRQRLAELVDGLRYARDNTAIAYVIGYGILIGVIGSPVETLLPVVTEEVYMGGTETYSRFLLFIGIGGIISTLGITLIGGRVRPSTLLAGAGVLVGIAYVGFAWTETLSLALGIAAGIGLLTVVKGTMSTTVVQTLVSDEYRGRVMSLMMFTWGAQAVGAVLMGIIAQSAGAPAAFAVAGVLVVIATGLVWVVALRRL